MPEYKLEKDGKGGPGTVITPSGDQLEVEPSLSIENHSPSGFQWGYRGSGPRQLSIALLLHHTQDPEFAAAHSLEFMRRFVARIDADETALAVGLLETFVQEKRDPNNNRL